jgi:phosphatidate cytidylyltransferase
MRARVLTALALIPLVLAAVFSTSPWPFAALLVLVTVIGVSEVVRLTGQVLAAFGAPFVALAILVFTPGYHMDKAAATAPWHPYIGLGGFFSAVFAIVAIALLKPPPDKSQVHALLASGWVVGPAASLFALHQAGGYDHPWHLPNPVLMAILPLWAGDTAAIFIGKAFGKRLLAPKISPKKTVEGSIANLLACLLAAWGIGAWVGVPVPQSLASGLAAGTLGQAGDLFESWVKRRADLKDSGTILPGHGGVLDRIDSLLFTAPAVALILLFWR